MRLLILLLGISGFVAGSAQALSCMRPDAANLYTWAQNSEETFYAALGRLDFPPPPGLSMPGAYEFKATLRGKSLTQNGFTSPLSTQVTVKASCAGPWCGQLPSGRTHLMMLNRIDGEIILQVTACPTTTLTDPSKEQIQTFLDCVQGNSCRPSR